MSSRIWGTDCTLWSAACWPWAECSAPTVEVPVQPLGVDATTLIQPWQEEETWNPYRAGEEEKRRKLKQKRLVKLICKVKGVSYDSEKEIKDFQLTVDDIKMIVKAMPQIDIDLKLED